MAILEYEFCVPLKEADGYESSSIEGVAEIEYSRHGEWRIMDIYLNGRRYDIGSPHNNPLLIRDRPLRVEGVMYGIVLERLSSEKCSRSIAYEVHEQLERDREPDPDAERERQLDDAVFFGDKIAFSFLAFFAAGFVFTAVMIS